MQIIDSMTMFTTVVSDMMKAKAFYVDQLGLSVKTDFRQDDEHWWVSLTFPNGGFTITLTTFSGNMKPGNVSMYFTTSDLIAAHKELSEKGVNVGEIQDNLYGPGSRVKFIKLEDPFGNWVHIAQA